VREAGFEPGAVLPSTLAAVAGLEETSAAPALVVNAGPQSVTTAIVEGGAVLLHRSLDMSGNAQLGILAEALQTPSLPLVHREATEQEWAMQQPEPQYGRDPYANDRDANDLAATIAAEAEAEARLAVRSDEELAPVYGQGGQHGAMDEVTQAVSVAAAYFEDTLQRSPTALLSAGSTSAEALSAMLGKAGFGVVVDGSGHAVKVTEMVGPEALVAQAASARVPRSWLAGVRGALRS
jgi:type IV pilus assembly protein PilM